MFIMLLIKVHVYMVEIKRVIRLILFLFYQYILSIFLCSISEKSIYEFNCFFYNFREFNACCLNSQQMQ